MHRVMTYDDEGNKVFIDMTDEEWAEEHPPTQSDVNRERVRRVLAGKEFAVSGYADTIVVSGDATTQTNLMALGMAAQVRIGQGDTTTLTPYRDEENTIHMLTPPQVLELWSVGAAYVSAIYQSSWAIKDDPDGIPFDFEDDSRWPA